MEPYKWSDVLALAAIDHCADIGPKRKMSHVGSDGSHFWDRVKRHSSDLSPGAENIGVGFESGIDFMLQFYIDEGVVGRGHRKNLINSQFTQTGMASCKYGQSSTMLVILYAY